MTTHPDNPHPTSSQVLVALDSVFVPPSRHQWVEMAVAGLNTGASASEEALQQLRRHTLEGIPLDVLYDSAEVTVTLPPNSAAAGTGKTQWDNRLCANEKTSGVNLTNTRILEALQGGITSIELHTPSAEALAGALQNVQLDIATISLRSGTEYKRCAAALKAIANTQGINESHLRCSFNADPLGDALSADAYHIDVNKTPIATQLEDMAHFAMAISKNTPLAHSVLVDTAIHHNAGASTVEELHAALATATLYLEAMIDAGMNTTVAAEQIIFQVAMDADVLLGVAKIRTLRALWLHTLQQFIDHTDDQTAANTIRPAFIVAETSKRYTSKLEPWNNHLRNLTASTAAFLGNTDALIVHPHDGLLRSDNNNSFDTTLGDRMARNIAIILERESGLSNVHDPMAGAYAVENLTRQLMQHTWQSLASTDTGEGWLDELHSGRWQTRLTHTHHQRVSLMKQEQRIAVGINKYVQNKDTELAATFLKKTMDEKTADGKAAGDKSGSPMALTLVREAEAFEQALTQEATS